MSSFQPGHASSVVLMVLATLLWSIAGVVSRQITQTQGFEVTFWRSFFTVISLALGLTLATQGRVWRIYEFRSVTLWLSGVCWSVMFTAFMLALTMTTVANVLITLSLGPLLTALLHRWLSGQALARFTWWSIAWAAIGIGYMFMAQVQLNEGQHLKGMLIAVCVPMAGSVQWNLVKSRPTTETQPNMLLAILIGAFISCVVTLPGAWPFHASPTDMAWLALLGVFQLALPCSLAVWSSRMLKPHEVAMLALLEVIFGITWAWLGANESPSSSVIAGGSLVLIALATNEYFSWRQRHV
ncbi:MAG: DMT family transporter [Limnohabitans sp.]